MGETAEAPGPNPTPTPLAGGSPPGPTWRRRLAVILIVVGAVLSPIALDALWIKRTVLDTDRFVAQLGPLADDPEIQAFVAQRVSEELIAQADLQTRLGDALPAELQFLDGTLGSAGNQLITTASTEVVQSEQFSRLWREALRVAHSKVVAVLTGDTNVVQVRNGVVTLDLSSLRNEVRGRIENTGLARFLPAASNQPLEITLYQSDALASAQNFVKLLRVLGFVLPFLVIVLFGAGIALALDRRKAVFRVGLGLTIAMVVHLAMLLLGRSAYLDAIVPTLPEPAANSLYDLLVYFPRVGTRTMVLVGILLMIGAAVCGSSALAARTRAVVAAGIGRAGSGVARADAPVPFTRVMNRYRLVFDIAVLVIAALILLSFDRITPSSLLVLVLLALLVLAIIHVLAAAGAGAPAGEGDQPVSGSGSGTEDRPPSPGSAAETPTAEAPSTSC